MRPRGSPSGEPVAGRSKVEVAGGQAVRQVDEADDDLGCGIGVDAGLDPPGAAALADEPGLRRTGQAPAMKLKSWSPAWLDIGVDQLELDPVVAGMVEVADRGDAVADCCRSHSAARTGRRRCRHRAGRPPRGRGPGRCRRRRTPGRGRHRPRPRRRRRRHGPCRWRARPAARHARHRRPGCRRRSRRSARRCLRRRTGCRCRPTRTARHAGIAEDPVGGIGLVALLAAAEDHVIAVLADAPDPGRAGPRSCRRLPCRRGVVAVGGNARAGRRRGCRRRVAQAGRVPRACR